MLNPFSIFKSKKYVDEIERNIHTMNKTNWRTSIVGIATCVMALAMIWAPAEYQTKIQATAAALAGVGLVAAKDHNN